MSLAHTAAAVMIPYLVSRGHVSNPGNNLPFPLFLNSLPTAPDKAVAIFDTDGVDEGREMRGGARIRYPGIMLQLRTVLNQEGAELGLNLVQDLDTLLRANVSLKDKGNVTHNYRINSVQRTSDVLPLGTEEGGSRLLFTINGLVTYGEI